MGCHPVAVVLVILKQVDSLNYKSVCHKVKNVTYRRDKISVKFLCK